MDEQKQKVIEVIAKNAYQYAYLVDDAKIDKAWTSLSENQSARFYACAETILSLKEVKEFFEAGE